MLLQKGKDGNKKGGEGKGKKALGDWGEKFKKRGQQKEMSHSGKLDTKFQGKMECSGIKDAEKTTRKVGILLGKGDFQMGEWGVGGGE